MALRDESFPPLEVPHAGPFVLLFAAAGLFWLGHGMVVTWQRWGPGAGQPAPAISTDPPQQTVAQPPPVTVIQPAPPAAAISGAAAGGSRTGATPGDPRRLSGKPAEIRKATARRIVQARIPARRSEGATAPAIIPAGDNIAPPAAANRAQAGFFVPTEVVREPPPKGSAGRANETPQELKKKLQFEQYLEAQRKRQNLQVQQSPPNRAEPNALPARDLPEPSGQAVPLENAAAPTAR